MGAISQFTASLNNVTRQYLNLSMLSLSVQELMEFMKIPLNNLNSGSDTPEFDKNSVIEFKNVSFRYPGSEKYALKNLNIVIHGNEKLCIVCLLYTSNRNLRLLRGKTYAHRRVRS